jgi:hypothetical protein
MSVIVPKAAHDEAREKDAMPLSLAEQRTKAPCQPVFIERWIVMGGRR